MGAGRPPLPAPTDVSSSAVGASDDVATELSRVTDRTSYTIPEDGSPVTIATRKVRGPRDQSQTSLLIEYFEGSKHGGQDGVKARPSVRVRVTPSASRKSGKREGEHIQITETRKDRKPSYTRRISLPHSSDEPLVPSEISSEGSARPPVEVEVLQGHSDLSQRSDAGYLVAGSNVSSIPPDSMLDGSTPAIITPEPRDPPARELERPTTADTVGTMDTLKAPTRQRSRSLSRERLAKSAVEKIRERQAADGGVISSTRSKGKSSRRSSGSSTREYVIDETASPKTRSKRSRDEEKLSTRLHEPSEVSALSASSAGRSSVRSGTSASSINNPKLLSAVEDAIKRLILPELNAVKEEQARQKTRMRFEDTVRDSMAPAGSRENLRRVSKSSSTPNVSGKSGITVDDREATEVSDGGKLRKSRRSSRDSEQSHETAIREKTSRRSSRERRAKKSSSHGAGKLAAAAIAGGALTAAALRQHESIESINEERERRERRKKRSSGRSRSASISRSVEGVTETKPLDAGLPLMPFHQNSSAIESGLTRDSIMSADTDRAESTGSADDSELQHREIHQVSRGSPRQIESPSPRTPTRTPDPNLAGSPDSTKSSAHRSGKLAAATLAAGGVAAATAQHNRIRELQSTESLSSKKSRGQHSKGSLDSPDMSAKNRPQGIHLESRSQVFPSEEVQSPGAADRWFEEEHQKNERLRDEYRQESEVGSDERRHTMYTDDSFADDHERSFESTRDIKNIGANPDYVHAPVVVESAVASLLEPSSLSSAHSSAKTESVNEELAQVQPRDGALARDIGDDRRYAINGTGSHVGTSKERWEAIRDGAIAAARQHTSTTSPRQSEASLDDRRRTASPLMGASAIPLADEPMPEIGHYDDDDSDVTTNPSIIKGPLGGHEHDDRSHWPYEPTPSLRDRDSSLVDHHTGRDLALGAGVGAAAVVGLGLATQRSQDSSKGHLKTAGRREPSFEVVPDEEFEREHEPSISDVESEPRRVEYASPGVAKGIDEGYMSAAVPGGDVTPDDRYAQRGFDGASIDDLDEEDPFTTRKHLRHASGLSHGMPSPLYDAATGKGIDRIKDRDVVALMDHLTVRDAHRNARDTEILVTLVRTAAEMRNQFEDMKKYIAEQDQKIMSHTDRAANRTTEKILGGPRAMPPGPARTRRSTSDMTDDSADRKKGLFRRAFKSLGSKSQDLTRIEDMLMQLLDEVEDLKQGQHLGGSQNTSGSQNMSGSQHTAQMNSMSQSLGSYDHLQRVQDPGYEPEGRAGTNSSPAQSGHLSSNPSSKHIGAKRSGYEMRRGSHEAGQRLSNVEEGDEEDGDWTQSAPARPLGAYISADGMHSPSQEARRGHSVPLDSSPAEQLQQGSRSAEDTPKWTEKGKKYKSGASSIFSAIPKISRWSKTTSSSVPEQPSGKRDRPYSQMSRSGSNVHLDDYDEYDLNEDDRLNSRGSFDSPRRGVAVRSPSPLIPEERRSIEDPKYQAHRDSLNLQHPQPRQGPTDRHHTYLENQVIGFGEPSTPDADFFGTTPALALNRLNRFSGSSGQVPSRGQSAAPEAGELSPVQSLDGGDDMDAYSAHSASEEQAHNRLPRPNTRPAYDDEPLVPSSRAGYGDRLEPNVPGYGYHSPYSNSGMHIASPLEPIPEARYSLETDRQSRASSLRREDMTPSPSRLPNLQVSGGAARKITGPRDMPASRRGAPGPGSAAAGEPISSSSAAQPQTLQVPRKPVGSGKASPVHSLRSLESYRDTDEDEAF